MSDIFLARVGGGNEISAARMWGKNEHFYTSLEKLCYYSLVGQLLVTSFKIRKAHVVEHTEESILQRQRRVCKDMP